MQFNEARQLCNNYRGQVVRIYDKSGNEHYGRISRVTEDRVWIEPVDERQFNNRSSRSSSRNRNDFNSGQSYGNSNRNFSNRDFSDRNFRRDNRFDRDIRRDKFDRDFRERDNFRCGFFGCGFGISIAIGFIAGVALAALFFF